jgi:hypothetical protein
MIDGLTHQIKYKRRKNIVSEIGAKTLRSNEKGENINTGVDNVATYHRYGHRSGGSTCDWWSGYRIHS